MQQRHMRSSITPIFFSCVLVLTGCSSSDDGPSTGSDNFNGLLPEGGSNTPADDLSNEEIQRSAADSMNRMLDLDTNELVATFDPESASPMDGDVTGDNAISSDTLNSSLSALLGLNEEDTESVTREGNVVSIELDENAICEDEVEGQDSCILAVQHISVTVDAASADSGVVSYLYRGEPAVRIGYAPNAGSYELRLDPWLTFIIDQRQFIWPEGDLPTLPEFFSGAIRVSVEADAEFPDELGSMAFALSEPVNIQSNADGLSITADVSELWSVGMTAIGGFFEFDLGASNISLPSDEDNSQMTEFASSGFTGRADIREDNGLLTVSNFGMSNGPITLTVDSGDVVQIAMETFGFTVAEADNEVILTGDLNLSVLASNLMSALDEDNPAFEFLLETLAPSGSAFSSNEDGSTQLIRGGPFSVSVNQTDETGTSQSNIVVEAGGCFDSITGGSGSSESTSVSVSSESTTSETVSNETEINTVNENEAEVANPIELVDCSSEL